MKAHLWIKAASRELKITLAIWAALMVVAIISLCVLNANSQRILTHIYAVNVSRATKASVVYAEARAEGRKALVEAEQLNVNSWKKVLLPTDNNSLRKSLQLFQTAFKLDIRPEFAEERAEDYELLGQLYDIAGMREQQLLTHAKAFIARGDYKNAHDYVAKAESLPDAGMELRILDAQLAFQEGRTSESIAMLEKINSSQPLSADGLYLLGTFFGKDGNFSQASVYLEQAVKLDPKDLNYRRGLGEAQGGDGRRSEAIKTLQAGLDDGAWMDPAYLHIYGDFLSDAGDLEEAIRVLKQADKLAPNSGDVQWSLARAYHRANKPRQADSALRRATAAKPELHEKIF